MGVELQAETFGNNLNIQDMKAKDLDKAIKLKDRIDRLSIMKRDLRPKFCNGVAFERTPEPKNDSVRRYAYHLFSTTPDCTKDDSIIMKTAIQAMYDKVCTLLDEAKIEFEKL